MNVRSVVETWCHKAQDIDAQVVNILLMSRAMNRFYKQLEQSQDDADLHRWHYAYEQYFGKIYGKVDRIVNTDTLEDSGRWQAQGVDHIVETEVCDIYCDFMLREKNYNDFFLEYEVNGKPGKFCRKDILTQYIAYSYRNSPNVYLFPFPQARRMVRDILKLHRYQFKHKESVSTENGRTWKTKGIIVPHNYACQHIDVRTVKM